jgi:hypothetical protein
MGDTIQSLTGRSKDDIMDPVEVAKKDKIGEMADHTTGQTEKKVDVDRSGVEKGKSEVGATMEDEEVKLSHEVVKEKGLKYAKKASVHFVSKGRGVSESKKDRARVKANSDSTDVDPFLTVCLSCVSTKKAHVGSWQNANCNADANGW